jgi:hypothetical protein
MEKVIGSLSAHNVAVMIHVLFLRNRYRSAAFASTDAYNAVDKVFQDMKKVLEDVNMQRRKAKEHQEHCMAEWMKFKAYADNFMRSPAHQVQGEDLP